MFLFCLEGSYWLLGCRGSWRSERTLQKKKWCFPCRSGEMNWRGKGNVWQRKWTGESSTELGICLWFNKGNKVHVCFSQCWAWLRAVYNCNFLKDIQLSCRTLLLFGPWHPSHLGFQTATFLLSQHSSLNFVSNPVKLYSLYFKIIFYHYLVLSFLLIPTVLRVKSKTHSLDGIEIECEFLSQAKATGLLKISAWRPLKAPES